MFGNPLSYRFFIWQLKRRGGGERGVSEKSLRTNVGGIRGNVTVRYNGGWGGGGVKLLFFCVTYFLNDPVYRVFLLSSRSN